MGRIEKSPTINRSVVAENCKGRALLLSKNPRMKTIGWDEINKIAVEVSLEEAIRFKMNPRNTYYLLIARCNTDMKGEVISDDFIVEYIQMAESIYSEYIDIVNEMGQGNSILLQRVSKGEYSYVKVTPATYKAFPKTLIEKVKAFRNNTDLIEGSWDMINSVTSRTVTEYVNILRSKGIEIPGESKIELPEKEKTKEKFKSLEKESRIEKDDLEDNEIESAEILDSETEGFGDFEEADDNFGDFE